MEDILTLLMLTFLQAVLGFDNLLYISLESQKVVPEKRKQVQKIGISLAIGLRIVLLFVILKAIKHFQEPVFSFGFSFLSGDFNVHSLIVLAGGAFIIYTAIKEIHHMLSQDELGAHGKKSQRSFWGAIFWIVAMNLVFSFDSILGALALTEVVWVMATAIIISGIGMIWLADRVSVFLEKNKMYEVLGLFILLIVGAMLISEGGHLAHLKIAGYPIEAMAKSTFYFVISVLVVIDIIQSKYQRKLAARKKNKKIA